jgi:hypothetical protein
VRAAYLEQNGSLTAFRYARADERPGLPIEPPADVVSRQHYGPDDSLPTEGDYACAICGQVRHLEQRTQPPPCDEDHVSWVAAVSPVRR